MRRTSTSLAALALTLLTVSGCNSAAPPAAPSVSSEPNAASAAAAAAAPAPAAPPLAEPAEKRKPNKADAVPAFAGQTRAPAIRTEIALDARIVTTGLSEPWGIAELPDGDLLITERTGKLKLVTSAGAQTEVAGVPKVDPRGQGGLLDISLAPDFATSREVYFSFAEPRGENRNGTSLAVAKLSADRTRLENVRVIFRQEPAWNSPLHFGSNIEWDRDGNLFLTLGERSHSEPRKLAQALDGHIGKVVRLKPDGTAAPGNPFLGRSDAKPEIWSYGHRNVQGAAIDPANGRLWTIEHGPRGGDELNAPEPGKNYGWPVIIYGIDYPGGPIGEGITAKSGLEQPVYYWDPVIAPGDMTFYTGDLFPWKGDLLISGLAGALVRLELKDGKVTGEERLLTDLGRIRDVEEAADGSLWLITDESNGKLVRVTPKG